MEGGSGGAPSAQHAVWILPMQRSKTGSKTWQNAQHKGQLDKKESYVCDTGEKESCRNDTGGKESYGSDMAVLLLGGTNRLLVTFSHPPLSGVHPEQEILIDNPSPVPKSMNTFHQVLQLMPLSLTQTFFTDAGNGREEGTELYSGIHTLWRQY